MTDSSPDPRFAEEIYDRLVKHLANVNEDLEKFAHVASHDLREPLRIIVCFSDLLLQEYGTKLEGQGRDYVEILRRAAIKMEAMVADLLDYGRIGQDATRFVDVDCNVVVTDAQEALLEAVRTTQAMIECAPLPTIKANPVRLSRVFQNLIGNAIKYQTPGQAPHIRIDAKDLGRKWEFSVSDNGIGIKEEYLHSIFAPFMRLHSDQNYAGTGIGLAICKSIVEGFGGRIHAKSVVGKGSVFYFTLPKDRNHAASKAQP